MSPTDNPPSPGKVGPPHRAYLTPTLFEHWYGFFHIPQELDIKVLVKANKWSIINAAFWLVELLLDYML